MPDGASAADVVVQDGVIAAVLDHEEFDAQDDADVTDLGDLVLMPGLVDTHVHLNEPGREEWEGFASGTKSARAGGVATLIDMPLNSSPVTTSTSRLESKRTSARGKLSVDVGFHAGLIPDNADRIATVIEAGAVAVKVFLCPSGIDEFPHSTERDLRIAMPTIAAHGVPLLVHAEIEHRVDAMDNPRRYRDYLNTRPPSFERRAIEMMIQLASETSCHVHIVHLSDAGCLPIIADARRTGVPLTVETCPHYLFFESESIGDGRTDLKCAPPIRNHDNREALWDGLRDGVIDMIVSDHSPCPPEMKRLDSGRFDQAWGGISSLQLGLPVVWTEAARRGFSMADVVRWMSRAPASLVGLNRGIAIGNPAHLVVFDPDATWVVNQTELLHRHAITPYHSCSLRGVVRSTYVHGDCGIDAKGQLL